MPCLTGACGERQAICECSADAPLTPVPLVHPPPPPARRGDNQCATEPCLGGNAGCNGNLCLGDGDCDADSDCVAGLLCGTENCAAFRNSDGWRNNDEGACMPQFHSPSTPDSFCHSHTFGPDTGTGDQTDDCCYSPGGLGSPNPLTATFKTCDVDDAETSGLTLMHTAPSVFFGDQTRGVRRSQVLELNAPVRAISITALTSDGWWPRGLHEPRPRPGPPLILQAPSLATTRRNLPPPNRRCVENITANGQPIDGLYGVWLDNPVQEGDYNRYPAFTTYTWRVPNPSNVIEFGWSTCDVSSAQTHGTLLLHLSEVRRAVAPHTSPSPARRRPPLHRRHHRYRFALWTRRRGTR